MEHFKWSVEFIFRVLRVSSFNDLYCALRPFLLTLTTFGVDVIEYFEMIFLGVRLLLNPCKPEC